MLLIALSPFSVQVGALGNVTFFFPPALLPGVVSGPHPENISEYLGRPPANSEVLDLTSQVLSPTFALHGAPLGIVLPPVRLGGLSSRHRLTWHGVLAC